MITTCRCSSFSKSTVFELLGATYKTLRMDEGERMLLSSSYKGNFYRSCLPNHFLFNVMPRKAFSNLERHPDGDPQCTMDDIACGGGLTSNGVSATVPTRSS
jgi:hypothetical protein